jgi:putative radical SAM enzyme (TIGR03279 family)
MVHRRKPEGGVVYSVDPGGLAEQAGVRPGDVLTHANGARVRDIIDVRFQIAEADVKLRFLREGRARAVRISKEIDDPLGIEFQDVLFDGIRRCQCRCEFCFYDQMRPGLRPTLYVRDDDFRLSFLDGNYLSLTNLTDTDYARIERQRLSPLYVSVHATDPRIRQRLMGHRRAGEIMRQLERLADADIEVHTQAVICAGINDGAVLDGTISDLAGLYPHVRSLAVVPLGVTDHGLRVAPITREASVGVAEARAILRQVHSWQERLRPRLGSRFVFASDEMYLRVSTRLPGRDRYEDFPQLDNGVGGTRLLVDEAERILRRIRRGAAPGIRSATLVTGTMLAPILARLVERLNGGVRIRLTVQPVANRFLGTTVTTAGLLAGRDIVQALSGRRHREVIVPGMALNAGRFIDDMTLAEVADRLRVRLRPARSLRSVLWPQETG